MVEQEEKQILPHNESVEIVTLGDGQETKEVKFRAYITAETKRDLIELLQEFKDIFALSYQDMLGLSTDIVVHRLPIKEDCKRISTETLKDEARHLAENKRRGQEAIWNWFPKSG